MASESADGPALRHRVVQTLSTTVPQLRHPRGAVERVDSGAGTVTLSLGCGCSAGLDGTTQQAIETILVENIEAVSKVQFSEGCGCGGHDHGSADEAEPEAPF